MEPDHAVLHRDAVHEGLLVVQEVGVGHPELVRHAVVQRQVEGDARVGQPLVPPVLLEVHGEGVVLWGPGNTHVSFLLNLTFASERAFIIHGHNVAPADKL